MTSENILTTVRDLAMSENLKPNEVIHMQRYFVHLHCTWLPYRVIGEMTGCKLQNVGHSIKIASSKKYELVSLRIGNKLRNLIK